MTLGKFLQSKRIEKNLTLEEVADYIGVPRGTVWKWEKDAVNEIRRSNINKLSTILGINPLVIIKWDEIQEHSDESLEINDNMFMDVAYKGDIKVKQELRDTMQHILKTINDPSQLKQIKMFLDTYKK